MAPVFRPGSIATTTTSAATVGNGTRKTVSGTRNGRRRRGWRNRRTITTTFTATNTRLTAKSVTEATRARFPISTPSAAPARAISTATHGTPLESTRPTTGGSAWRSDMPNASRDDAVIISNVVLVVATRAMTATTAALRSPTAAPITAASGWSAVARRPGRGRSHPPRPPPCTAPSRSQVRGAGHVARS